MIKVPKNLITISEAAKRYGFKPISLLGYAKRKRLEAVKLGWAWYTTHAAMKTYLKSRDMSKIPLRHRKKED